MKHIIHLLLLYIVCLAGYSQDKQNTQHIPIETIIADLNNDKVTDTLLLYQRPVEGDPGLFTKITIALGNYGRHTFQANDVWDRIDSDFSRKTKNSIVSDNVFILTQGNTSFIFLFGFLYGSGREEIAIISIEGSKAGLYFHNKLAEPVQLTDLDKDGTKELICQDPPQVFDLDEATSAPIGAYSPYLVYKLDKEIMLDKKLTEDYNKKYYVWAGFKYDENIKVVYTGGKSKLPYIIK